MARTLTVGQVVLETDEDGFLQTPTAWTLNVAHALAVSEGVDDLTGEHWKVVNFIRDYYLQHGVAPMLRMLTRSTGHTLAEIYDLFPSGPARGACKIAGLPRSVGCV
ncbi:MAG: TusE/DsrC/DsvC family sulfur relay protein [Deltaproteobacteria bacterium]|nr:TusE/DsrC/DsvC family sulfur relay protein [Deltaproteobacteria bacterium]